MMTPAPSRMAASVASSRWLGLIFKVDRDNAWVQGSQRGKDLGFDGPATLYPALGNRGGG